MRFASLLLIFGVAGCATHTWAPGPGVSVEEFGPAKARCSLMARAGATGFAAQGSTSFVAGAALGNAIGNSIKAQADFNDCMVSSGWQIADQSDAEKDRIAAVKEQIKAAGDSGKACKATVKAEPQYSAIVQHFSNPDTGKYRMEQLSDTAIPTEAEAKLVAQFFDEMSACNHAASARFSEVVPATGPILDKAMYDIEQITRKLVRREISWGDYAQFTADSQSETQSKLARIHL